MIRRPALVSWALLAAAATARGEEPRNSRGGAPSTFSNAEILGQSGAPLRLESVFTRITAYDQSGHGYQSQAGPIQGPGSERATILEPHLEAVATQGPRLRHRFSVPVDIVTAASADAIDRFRDPIDVVSSASRYNTSETFDWTTTYKADADSDVSIQSGLHIEEPFRSWHAGAAGTRSFAEGNTTLFFGLHGVFDWFDHFDIQGFRSGRASRSSTTATVGLTQILTPTTVANVNYGLTVQEGELGNTWNSVPGTRGKRHPELLPEERLRHALVARVAQFLPWNGALRLYYRYYTDSWGLGAHSVEAQLLQRLSSYLYIGATYRFHTQTGVDFFTKVAIPGVPLRTADSDLAPLSAQTVGGKVVFEVPVRAAFRSLHFDLGYERYTRTNDLQMNMVTWATGYRF